MPNSGGTFIFNYGSNNLKRLAKRIGSSEVDLAKHTYSATAHGYKLVFCGRSKAWGDTSPAHIIKCEGSSATGLAVRLSQEEIEKLDWSEGHPNLYKRKPLQFTLHGLIEHDMVTVGEAYVKEKNFTMFTRPSDAYLQACCRT